MIVIPNGFDTRRFRPCPQARREVRDELGIAPDALIVGLVARYDPLKDHATFLRAAAAIVARRPETFFLLCGQNIDSHNRALVEQIQSLGLTGHCRLLGPRRDMQRVYPALDVLASSSISEAFPLVVGEAMACGVPCAVTDVGDSALIVGETGKVVPRANPQALARAIEELLAMKADARGQLGQAARQRVCELFDLDSVTQRYEAIYEQLARERSARPGEYRRDDCATLERQARMPAPPWPSPQARVASPMPSADAGTLRPLKILMVVESSAGGTGRHVLELSEGLMARGCQVHLARSTRRVDQMFLGRLAKLPAIRQIALPMRTGIHPGDFAISRAIRRYARQFGPFDVVHGHSSKGGAFARLAALGTGAAAFYTLHGLIMMDPLLGRWKRLVYLMMERAMALRTARIIAVSPEEQRAAIGLGLGKSRVVLIPNGVAPAELSPRAKARQAIGLADDDALAIGFVGRLVSQKAVDVLLRAFARVVESAPHARLALVGAGPLEAELRTLAEQLSVGERVLWLGERDAREVLAAFEIFAIASRKDGLLCFLFHSLFRDERQIEQNAVNPLERTTVAQFRELIEYYLAIGYRFIVPGELLEGLKPDGKYAMITFDDGYYNNLQALPVLEELDVPAIFFISTKHIARNKCFWWDVFYREQIARGVPARQVHRQTVHWKSMRTEDIERELLSRFGPNSLKPRGDIDRPFTAAELRTFAQNKYVHLGNHTADHAILTNYCAAQVREQVSSAQEWLAEIIGRPPVAIAYPNGAHNDRVVDICAQAGLKIGFTIRPVSYTHLRAHETG